MTKKTSLANWTSHHKLNPKARLRLFCFPYAGSGASIFRKWAEGLPADIEVCPIQLPGRENRIKETPFTQLSQLVKELVPSLVPYLDIPFAFFGHSMGALISFEIARQLRRELNLEPSYMFVSSRRAPQIADPNSSIHQLPDSAFIEELCRFNGMPKVFLQHAELMRLVLPTLRADFSILETYLHSKEEAFNCPIFALGGLQDPKVSYGDLAAWRDQTKNSFTLQLIAGDHFFLKSAHGVILSLIYQELMNDLNPKKWTGNLSCHRVI